MNNKLLNLCCVTSCFLALCNVKATEAPRASEIVRMVDAPLSAIAEEFNRLDPELNLKIEGEALRQRRFVISFHYSGARAFVEYLKKVFPELVVIYGNNGIIVRERTESEVGR